MAQVDAGIYRNIRPFQMSDPMDQAAKFMTMQNAGMSMEKNRRALQTDDDIKAAGMASGGDPTKLVSELMSRGQVGPATELQGKLTTQQKQQLEMKLKIAEATGSDALGLDAAYRNAAAQGGPEAAIQAITPMYQQIRQKWAGLGVQLPEQFDPVQNQAGIGQAKDAARYFGAQLSKFGTPQEVTRDGKPAMVQTDQFGNVRDVPGVGPKKDNPTELARLTSERDALPEGDPRRQLYDRVLQNYKAGKGDTNVTVNSGPMLPGKKAQGDIDADILTNTRSLMQLNNIAGQFKPEYQTIGTKAGMTWASIKEKAGADLDTGERRKLTEFAAYRRNAFGTLNDYIKAITGAALSVAEAERIMKAMPNPGSGLFDGDSPTEFKAKLDDVIAKVKQGVARAAYMKRNGMSMTDQAGNPVIPLERMPMLMRERAAAIEQQLRSTGGKVSDVELKKAVRSAVAKEFGLVE